jgi:hypothetical protein
MRVQWGGEAVEIDALLNGLNLSDYSRERGRGRRIAAAAPAGSCSEVEVMCMHVIQPVN